MGKRLCVFCGSHMGNSPIFAQQASELGRSMARRGLELVFGGGHIGLMGALADAVLEAGGAAIGVIPKALVDRELAHDRLTTLHIVSSMHERKALMADLSDAFVALPGGYGTADELFEILTWAQLGLHAKPIGILNSMNFFHKLLAWIEAAREDVFLHGDAKLLVETDIEKLLDQLFP